MGIIILDNLRLTVMLGAYSWEERTAQTISCKLKLHLMNEVNDDKLSSTIDYDTLVRDLKNHLLGRRFSLIETVAKSIVEFIFDNYPVKAVSLKVIKHAIIDEVQTIAFKLKKHI